MDCHQQLREYTLKNNLLPVAVAASTRSRCQDGSTILAIKWSDFRIRWVSIKFLQAYHPTFLLQTKQVLHHKVPLVKYDYKEHQVGLPVLLRLLDIDDDGLD